MNKKIKNNLKSTFRALKHRNYLLFFFGQGISLVGTWIQQIAISWLIYRLTNSPLIMGVIAFVGSIPALIVSPFAGVVIDRINKYKCVILIQILFMLEALALAILTLTGVVQVWHIVIISTLMGITNSIDMPLRQSFVVELVEGSDDLSNAISLNSSSFNLARLLGPAIAGVLIASVGEGTCFLINSLSYIAVIGSLLAMKIDSKPITKAKKMEIFEELKEGFNYAYKSLPIRYAILYLGGASFIGMAFPVLMPIYAKAILHGGAQTLGFLMSASGIGALIGALHLASKRSVAELDKFIIAASILFGISLIGLALIPNLIFASIFMFLTGLGMVTIMASSNTLIQHWVDDKIRGRVMSIYTMAFIGTAPLGSLCGGAVADKIGVPDTFILSGFFMIAIALIFGPKLKSGFNPEIA